MYAVAADTGRRVKAEPAITLTVDEKGHWGPFRADAGQYYEFCLTPSGMDRPIHIYREPFRRTDLLVYLKTRDPQSQSGKEVEALLHVDDASSIFVVSQLNGAIIAGRDSLKVNGLEIATEEIAKEKDTKVGFYIFDANDNGKTDGTPPAAKYFSGPFITGADVFIQSTTPETVTFEFNGKTLNIPNWKAESEGQIVVQFD